ncbi:hypothetical protein RGQ13_08650 [Thalassotalea psychrophila]|uniref:Uncharacterized protein n=1 Tax=Thalassotalea psychrophila TaxID=3065647 RepID=A0ABY9TYZ2_9GAMM|nr:hypothetical protein RGQ13_08650 [Colwelliaceae bacterium SQ149]
MTLEQRIEELEERARCSDWSCRMAIMSLSVIAASVAFSSLFNI